MDNAEVHEIGRILSLLSIGVHNRGLQHERVVVRGVVQDASDFDRGIDGFHRFREADQLLAVECGRQVWLSLARGSSACVMLIVLPVQASAEVAVAVQLVADFPLLNTQGRGVIEPEEGARCDIWHVGCVEHDARRAVSGPIIVAWICARKAAQ